MRTAKKQVSKREAIAKVYAEDNRRTVAKIASIVKTRFGLDINEGHCKVTISHYKSGLIDSDGKKTSLGIQRWAEWRRPKIKPLTVDGINKVLLFSEEVGFDKLVKFVDGLTIDDIKIFEFAQKFGVDNLKKAIHLIEVIKK